MMEKDVKLNKNIFLLAVIILFGIYFSINFISALNCWNYTAQSTCEGNSCKWKNDSWGSWCEEFQCWTLNTQTQCSNSSLQSTIGKNCTWEAGGASNYCGQVSCWNYAGTNQSYCETNPSGRSCEWRSECYSNGGGGSTSCWGIASQSTCTNTTGCAWGNCQDKGCWAYSNSSSCSIAKDPWNGRNCSWSSSGSYCTENNCGSTTLYPNQSVCNSASHCRWQGSSTSGWCEGKSCWNYDGNQTGCSTANTTIGKDCKWNNGYCNEDSCWSYDTNQTGCSQKTGCSWQTSTTSGWCEEVNCWNWDSTRGGNQTQCESNSYGMACTWSGNPSGSTTNGWCYKDVSSATCSNITTEKACYDTSY